MCDTLDAAELRRWAMRCAARADDDKCLAEERDRLLTIREALLALAVDADWLVGRPTMVILPRPLQKQRITKSA